MEACLSGIAGRESWAIPRPNNTNASYVRAYHRSLLVRLSAPADIRRSKLTASPCTNTRGREYSYHTPSKPVRCELIISRSLISSPRFPAKRLSVEQQAERLKLLRLANQDQESVCVQEAQLPIKPEPLPVLPTSPDHVTQQPQPSEGSSEKDDVKDDVKADEKGAEIEGVPPVFELEMTVSSGTYVRSIVHDLAIAVGSAAHVVSLTRTRQGAFVSPSYTAKAREDVTRSIVDVVTEETRLLDCVDWAVLEDALRKLDVDEEIAVDVDGWANWELEIMQKWPDQSGLKIASYK